MWESVMLSEGCLIWRASSFHYDWESYLPCHPGNEWYKLNQAQYIILSNAAVPTDIFF